MTALLRFSSYSSNRKAGVRGVVRLEILKEGEGRGYIKGTFLTVILKYWWGRSFFTPKGTALPPP
jgi:hypothetical protein